VLSEAPERARRCRVSHQTVPVFNAADFEGPGLLRPWPSAVGKHRGSSTLARYGEGALEAAERAEPAAQLWCLVG